MTRRQHAYLLHRMRGVTLIELVVFIVIVAIVVIAMVQAFSGTSRGVVTGKILTEATQAAQQRMEVILGQARWLRFVAGYASITAANYDPCPPVGAWANQACASGPITVSSSANFAANACGAGTGADCFEVTVTAIDTGGYMGAPLTLKYQISNY